MKKLTAANTCPHCGGGRIRETWRFRANGKCLECVECGCLMKARKRRRWFVFV